MRNDKHGEETSLFSDLKKDNVLIFATSFTAGQNVKDSIGPNTSVEGWQFILSRSKKQVIGNF